MLVTRSLRLLICAVFLPVASAVPAAAAWPEKAVTLVHGFGTGGNIELDLPHRRRAAVGAPGAACRRGAKGGSRRENCGGTDGSHDARWLHVDHAAGRTCRHCGDAREAGLRPGRGLLLHQLRVAGPAHPGDPSRPPREVGCRPDEDVLLLQPDVLWLSRSRDDPAPGRRAVRGHGEGEPQARSHQGRRGRVDHGARQAHRFRVRSHRP